MCSNRSWGATTSIKLSGTGGFKQTWGSEAVGAVGRSFRRTAHPLNTFWLLTCGLHARCLRRRSSGQGRRHPVLPLTLCLV
jgi:hypothetical protein